MIKQHLRLFLRTFNISTTAMLVYRANIVFFLVFETVFFAAQFLAVTIGYNLAGSTIAGWSRDQAYVLTAVSSLSHQLFVCFFIGPIFSVASQVWSGYYDYILLKPLPVLSSMWFSGQFVIANMPNLALCVASVIYFVAHSGGTWSVAQLGLFAVLVLAGVGVRIGLALLCVAPVFYADRAPDLEQGFWSVASLGRYQLEIYPWWLRGIFVFIVPLGTMAALPATVLTRPFDGGRLVLAALAALAFLGLAGWIYLASAKRYQSVNSGF